MSDWQQIIYILLLLFIAWLIYRNIKQHPEWLSRENLSKSFSSMGILALILIAFVGVLVFMLRAS
jgi:putative copper export protein